MASAIRTIRLEWPSNKFIMTTGTMIIASKIEYAASVASDYSTFWHKFSLVWSFHICISCLIKSYFRGPRPIATSFTGPTFDNSDVPTVNYSVFRDVLLLDYLPEIEPIRKIYHGFVGITVAAAAIWRLWLNYGFRPNTARRQHECKLKTRVLRFMLDGPNRDDGSGAAKADKQHPVGGDQKLSWPPGYQQMAAYINMDESQLPENARSSKYRKPYLSHLHEPKVPYRSYSSLEFELHYLALHGNQGNESHGDDELPIIDERFYRNPVVCYDFLHNHNQHTWLHQTIIFRRFVVVILVLTLPLGALHLLEIYLIMTMFTCKIGPKPLHYQVLEIYGLFEQAYICSQACMMFFHGALVFCVYCSDLYAKSTIVVRDLTKIERLYSELEARKRVFARQQQQQQHHNNQSINSNHNYRSTTDDQVLRCVRKFVHYRQLRLWTYMDTMKAADTYVSIFSLMSFSLFVVAVSFVQTYVLIADLLFKLGTLGYMLAVLATFTFLFMVSWTIERRNILILRRIYYVLARDDDFVTRRYWQKILDVYFKEGNIRTFSLKNSFPLNINTYLKILYGLSTVIGLTQRLFFK